jgi:hypothetical protein
MFIREILNQTKRKGIIQRGSSNFRDKNSYPAAWYALFLALTFRSFSDILLSMRSRNNSYAMKLIIFFLAVLIMFSLSCCNHGQGDKQPDQLHEAEDSPWENGQEIAISGVIYPSKANARFYLQTEDGRGAHIKHGTDIDILEAGTKLRVKGTIEYVPYEKPEDYDEKQYGAKFPQTICYIAVEEFTILE